MTVFELYLYMGEGDFDPGRVEAQLDLFGDLPFGLEEIIGRHITVDRSSCRFPSSYVPSQYLFVPSIHMIMPCRHFVNDYLSLESTFY